MSESFSNYMTDIDGHFIIIKNVPCHKCSQCGEILFTSSVIEKIETLLELYKNVASKIFIVDYKQAA